LINFSARKGRGKRDCAEIERRKEEEEEKQRTQEETETTV